MLSGTLAKETEVSTGAHPSRHIYYKSYHTNSQETIDAVEVCSGKGLLTRCLRRAGYRVAAFDILDWEDYARVRQPSIQTNPLDMLTPAGMAFRGAVCLGALAFPRFPCLFRF